ncbi:MAG: D-alanyl-D-alanine carboxypeptidase [Rhodospirillales bacterium]|nr:D-alanyl-D-alanine carboxypeptidase [Rhodospirillales bacterium]
MRFKTETIRRFKIGIAGLFCALAFAGLSPGQAQARYASIVVDAGTGEVLHQVNADTRNYPASLTKMMTLYLAFEALDRGRLKMDQALPVSRRAAGISPSKLGLRRGQSIRVRDAILSLVTKSANDAAVVIAEALAGSEIKFAQQMTAKAKALGMKRTNFRNASGLPNRSQLSTARDMARLAQALIEDYPQFYTYFSTEKFTYKGRTYSNHNSLLGRYAGADGLKTGYTRASGFNLAASSLRDGRRLIAVVFGGKTASSRDRHIASLLDKGFASPTMTRPLTARAGPSVAPPPRKPASLAAVPTPAHKPENLIAGSAAGATARTAAALVVPRKKPELEKPVEVALQPWGVQVGAFYNANPAKLAAAKAAQRFPDLLGETLIMTPTIKGRRGDIYRARLMGLSEERARNACKRLRSARIDCLVVRSRETIKVALN